MRLSTAAFLSFAGLSVARGVKRQTGPVDSNTNPYCTYYDTAYSEFDDCAYFEDFWGISHQDFVAWNPSVKSDCSGIRTGNSYCVQASQTPPSEETGVPTQDGIIESCTTLYKAVEGDNCLGIVARFGTFSRSQFLSWNPAVGSDCRPGPQAGMYYCVDTPDTPNKPTPSVPMQDGLIQSCTTLYKAVDGDKCLSIVAKFGTFSRNEFLSWNPAVGSNCEPGPKSGEFYCVGVPGTPSKPACETAKPTTTTSSGNGIATPTPTQLTIASDCDQFYLVQKDQTCQQIAARYGISEAQFQTWNPSVGSDCKGLWANAYACVHTIGFQYPVSLDCSSSALLWGDNQPAASSAVVDWCDGKDRTDGSQGFSTGQSKYGCFNAPYGQHKIEFWARNDFGVGSYLSEDKCNMVMNTVVNQCDRGGEGKYESWYYKAMVGDGRC